jgi:hypothetical protein
LREVSTRFTFLGFIASSVNPRFHRVRKMDEVNGEQIVVSVTRKNNKPIKILGMQHVEVVAKLTVHVFNTDVHKIIQ